jgi:putative acetyltransferase
VIRVIVRTETPQDLAAIREVNIAAFESHPFSHQTEHLIVEGLRAAGALELSLVAEIDGDVVGHIAFSAAGIGGKSAGWFLLGPVAVLPEHQREGIGRALVEGGLDSLRSRGACGCVLVGDPAFYGRFGFRQHPGIEWKGVPDTNVLCLQLSGDVPAGEVSYHPAFLIGM